MYHSVSQSLLKTVLAETCLTCRTTYLSFDMYYVMSTCKSHFHFLRFLGLENLRL